MCPVSEQRDHEGLRARPPKDLGHPSTEVPIEANCNSTAGSEAALASVHSKKEKTCSTSLRGQKALTTKSLRQKADANMETTSTDCFYTEWQALLSA